MSAKIAAGLALLLALAGWGLYEQITTNGEMREQLRKVEADLKAERGRVETLRLEIEERDLAVQLLQVRYDELRERKAKVQTVVRKVYVQPDVQDWAETPVPTAVVAAVAAGIDELYQPTAADPNRGAVTAGGDDARL